MPPWLDQELTKRCRKAFDAGDYENAVFSALKVFETRASGVIGEQEHLFGVKLMDALLSPDKGKLRLATVRGEQEGVHQTVRGLFLWLRDSSGHRFVEYGPERACEVICFVNFLLSFLRQSIRSEIPVRTVETVMDRYIMADFDGDGTQEKVIVTLPDFEKNRRGQLLVLDPSGSDLRKVVLLEDFPQHSLYFLEARDLNSDGVLEIIASSPAGAHGERMHIFRWDGQSYVCVGEFFSDAPSIEIEDVDHDGMDEVTVKQRDYKTDPMSNSIFQIFHWVDGRYQLMQERKTAS